MSRNIKITEPNGRIWEVDLEEGRVYSVGRAKENDIVLNDRRASRKHAQVGGDNTGFRIIDGYIEKGKLVRSVNHVFVNGSPVFEKVLTSGDVIVIGESRLEYFEDIPTDAPHVPEPDLTPDTEQTPDQEAAQLVEEAETVDYDDKPLGHTQVEISANEIIGRRSHLSIETAVATAEEIKDLRTKA